MVPLDGSDVALRAVPVGVSLASVFDAEVVLVTIPATRNTGRMVAPVWLEAAARSTSYPRVRTEMFDAMRTVDGIATVVATSTHPIVCMATHGRGAVGTAILGSVTRDVVRHLSVPTVLVGPHAGESLGGGTGPLLVAHDGSVASDAILPAARDWSAAADRAIVVAHVRSGRDMDAATQPPQSVTDAVTFLHAEVADVTLRELGSSHPVPAILAIAQELDATAIASSTHGRSALARMTLGSVAASLAHAAPCPVMVIRPRDLS